MDTGRDLPPKFATFALRAAKCSIMNLHSLRITAVLAGTLFAASMHAADSAPSPDLVVYGGTASGVMTAYSAAREGLRVVLLEPGVHLGGMVTGGLSATDLGHYTIIGGYARDFYMKAAEHYGVHALDRPENWLSEPHVDEEIFRTMLQNAGVTVQFHERLREQNGVELRGKRIVSMTTLDGKHWPAKIFADCSYEGDLMAQAKVTYTWGREDAAEYAKTLPEFVEPHRSTSFSGRSPGTTSIIIFFRR